MEISCYYLQFPFPVFPDGHFCTKNIHGPDLTLFLIPFTEVIHLIERKKLLDGFAKYSKFREL